MTADGRVLKGRRRRAALLDATMRVIERAGVEGLSQRVVAAEAGVAPSVVTYYFPAVDDLLAAALTGINDAYLRALADCARDPDPIAALTRLVVVPEQVLGTACAVAEYELFSRAAWDPAWRAEYQRWADGLDRFLAPHVADRGRRLVLGAAVDGLIMRARGLATPPPYDDVRRALGALVPPGTG